jgi:hypothetical protein
MLCKVVCNNILLLHFHFNNYLISPFVYCMCTWKAEEKKVEEKKVEEKKVEEKKVEEKKATVQAQEEAPAEKPVSKVPFVHDICPYAPLYWMLTVCLFISLKYWCLVCFLLQTKKSTLTWIVFSSVKRMRQVSREMCKYVLVYVKNFRVP